MNEESIGNIKLYIINTFQHNSPASGKICYKQKLIYELHVQSIQVFIFQYHFNIDRITACISNLLFVT